MKKREERITNDDVLKYEPMIESYIHRYVAKNWNEAQTHKNAGDIFLGCTGWTLNDIRQHLRQEVFIAIQNYDPEYTNKDGIKAKESTFVYHHLWLRCGQLMKRLTHGRKGYGVFHRNLEEILGDVKSEE